VRLRSVVTCEHHDGIFRDAEPIEFVKNFADVMVNLHLDVGIVAAAGFTGKVRIGECRIVRLGDSLTVSFLASISHWCMEAAWAPRQAADQGDGEAAAAGGDRGGDVAFRPRRGRRAAGNLGVAQVPRSARG
jgi:hypothetical protein